MSEGGGGRGSLVLALVGAVGGGEVACVDAAGGRLAAGGGRALRVWLWAAGAGWRLEGAAPRAHRYAVTSVRWAPAGALLASGGVDGLVKLWGCTPTGGLEERAAMAAAGATAVRALSWAGARLLVGHDDGAATVWLWGRGELAAVLRAHTGALHALAATADGALMLTACTEGVLKLHDLEEVGSAGCEGGEVSPLAWEDGAHDLGALCAAACPRGALLATGGQDARVRMWSVTRGGASGRGALCDLGCLDGHEGAVTGVRWGAARDAAGARLLASCSLDRTARVWSVAGEGAAAEAACVLLLHAHARIERQVSTNVVAGHASFEHGATCALRPTATLCARRPRGHRSGGGSAGVGGGGRGARGLARPPARRRRQLPRRLRQPAGLCFQRWNGARVSMGGRRGV